MVTNSSVRRRSRSSVVLLGALAFGACGGQADPEGGEIPFATSGEQIINGSTVATDAVGTALVRFPGSRICSGTILHSRWLLTAGHCITTDGQIGGPLAAPSAISAQLLGGSNAPTGVATWRHPLYDVALVRLNAAPLNAAGQVVTNRLYRDNVSDLASQTFYTQGWGNSQITQCSPTYAGSGAGTLLAGNINVSSVSGAGFTTVPTGFLKTIEWTGDSGSSLLKTVRGIRRPIGVESTGFCTQNPLAVTSIGHIRADYFRSWAEGIIGTAPSVGWPSGYERSDGYSTIVYRQIITGHVRELALGADGTWGVSDLTTASGSNVTMSDSQVAAYIRDDGADVILFKGSDGHVRELALTNTGWQANDLSGAGVGLAADSTPAGYVRSDRISVVVYRGTDNHIHELSRNADGTWSNADLSGRIGAPTAKFDPIGYVRADGVSAVVYSDFNNHVIEIALNPHWGFTDLSSATGATDAARAVAQPPRPYTRPDGYSIVVYVDASQRIQEMNLAASGNTWGIASLSNKTGTTTTAASPYVRADGVPAVLYLSTDNHLREAELFPTGWSVTDLTAVTGAPAPLNQGPAGRAGVIPNGYVRSDGLNTVVYTTPGFHIIELALSGTTWGFNDITDAAGGGI